jgi:hypothetical protein
MIASTPTAPPRDEELILRPWPQLTRTGCLLFQRRQSACASMLMPLRQGPGLARLAPLVAVGRLSAGVVGNQPAGMPSQPAVIHPAA